MTKTVENQKILEEAMYNKGLSRVRAAKIAYYMTRCEGQFQEWDFLVKKKPRVKNQIFREESVLDLTTESMPSQLESVLAEDGEDNVDDENSDRDGNETTREIGEESQRLRNLNAIANGRVRPAKIARGTRSRKDERQRRRDRKGRTLRIKEYVGYTREDYVHAARRYDTAYGSAENLYQVAQDHKDTRLIRRQDIQNQPTIEMMIDGHLVDVEDSTFGLTQPSAGEALTGEERRARDLQHKQLRADEQSA